MNTFERLLEGISLPRMVKMCQTFDETKIEDVLDELAKELARPAVCETICPGMRIAITCTSRGIDNHALIIREIAAFCKKRGAAPFIVPAMGSHGGATAEGQLQMCRTLGVTEEYCGCPILSSMEVVPIGETSLGHTVCIDRNAAEADGIILINRIKSHTAFRGPYESGLMKAMTIGLGKQYGAHICHRTGYSRMAEMIPLIGNVILRRAPVLFGVGLVENAYDRTCLIKALTNAEIPLEEPKLLEAAKKRMPRLLPGSADVLIVDRIGKNISGSGMDSNITGRAATPYAGPPKFQANKVVVLDVTEESHGNIHGVGYADLINRRVFDKGRLEVTYPNGLTSTTIWADKIPMIHDSDRRDSQIQNNFHSIFWDFMEGEGSLLVGERHAFQSSLVALQREVFINKNGLA